MTPTETTPPTIENGNDYENEGGNSEPLGFEFAQFEFPGTSPTPTTPATNEKANDYASTVSCGSHRAESCSQCPLIAPNTDTRLVFWNN